MRRFYHVRNPKQFLAWLLATVLLVVVALPFAAFAQERDGDADDAAAPPVVAAPVVSSVPAPVVASSSAPPQASASAPPVRSAAPAPSGSAAARVASGEV